MAGLDSDVMKDEELRSIHVGALRFLHYYVNSFKILRVDEIFQENEQLEKELTEISRNCSGEEIF